MLDPGPARTFVFIVERPESMLAGTFWLSAEGARTFPQVFPERFEIVDWPGFSHGQADSLSFGDGHCELKEWHDPRTAPATIIPQSIPLYHTRSPNNMDVWWLQEGYTRPRK
jgi:hypothetical protein